MTVIIIITIIIIVIIIIIYCWNPIPSLSWGRFCWSILQTNEQTLKAFLEKCGASDDAMAAATCR